MRLWVIGIILLVVFIIFLFSFGVALLTTAKGNLVLEILMLVSIFGAVIALTLIIAGLVTGIGESEKISEKLNSSSISKRDEPIQDSSRILFS